MLCLVVVGRGLNAVGSIRRMGLEYCEQYSHEKGLEHWG